jgi:phosphohistidine phosphatase
MKRAQDINLFFLRHAKACVRSRKWSPDSTRPLSGDGEKKMFEAARGIRSLDVSFDLILTSPYIRAFRTAEILGEVFESKKVFETKNLVPEADPEAVIGEINENFSTLKQIVLVGHEPFMTRLMSVLLSGKDNLSMDLRKGGLCKLSVKHLCCGSCASLAGLMTPRQLARLARGK